MSVSASWLYNLSIFQRLGIIWEDENEKCMKVVGVSHYLMYSFSGSFGEIIQSFALFSSATHTPSGLSFQVKIVWFNLTP